MTIFRLLISHFYLLKRYKIGTIIGIFIPLFSVKIIKYSFYCSVKLADAWFSTEPIGLCNVFDNDLTQFILLPLLLLGGLMILIIPTDPTNIIFHNLFLFLIQLLFFIYGYDIVWNNWRTNRKKN